MGVRTVKSGEVSLAVYEQGDPADPTVLLVHGYPDNHTMWDGVAARLAERFHVVSYDVRGAGASSRPREVSQYALSHLADDMLAVADAVSPSAPVHVVAHDWGSIQAWHAVTEPHSRFASFTSISGPCLDHIGYWTRKRLSRPTLGNLRQVLKQQLHSWYILAFHVPVLAALAWRLGVGKQIARIEGLSRVPAKADGIDGMKLYRANIFQRTGAPEQRRTEVPVQVIMPTRDRYMMPALLEDLQQWAPRLWKRKVIGKHWVAAQRPAVIARMAEEFIAHVLGEPVTRGLQRAQAPDSFEHRLVVITGAGSGIGRATALEFAAQGADVIVTDIDLSTAAETASLIGPSASAYQLDVTDESAVRRLADTVALDHGVPDVVVNNAGIGVAGPFMDTSPKDWQRVVDVNLLGVVHGCQAFGELMIEAGEGGHIVNIASAAAYTPSHVLPAYSTTKAAVLMLSECLRAEMVPHGIGVSAICPGLIDTSITRTTTFVGVSADEQQSLRDRSAKAYRRRNFPPSRVATAIVGAVKENRAVVPVTVEAKAGLLGSRLAPGIMRRLARIGVSQ
ncbi:NAD(P)-dependent dehydrogenase (short-subunit alcohol dehydrogenase family)/pimeloyl-ACP methyl ester carboxylesterase [Kibdelosporangium banguiense]|uniref:NAD(P)-dependent dehydrogenase (Short-subunit alcohol dehydrogenase family)/pimeloyl-ACP methyl ester carboxylesterase n=1 Tax=Kibdelosporangium banguiense TaxID=1365924 RepID=A0ABS4T8Z4_9PSEU|nr:SDR family oxidoreductase [Kibdelosporangium banguiense]MBP2320895.1 NAD(P)-dependent dehydrogenase (short-subunit alcohol dehydrogenase family)/pimeloyl-ACP methyl ester carboxylesterase [Kibdelosporangium banguiense]